MYLKILDELCYIHIMRLHLYLSKFERYISVKDYFRNNKEIISEFLSHISIFLSKYNKKHVYIFADFTYNRIYKIFLQTLKILNNILWVFSNIQVDFYIMHVIPWYFLYYFMI